MIISRFAPSPTGYLHLGHAYSAYLSYRQATDNNGRFILRIEDIDTSRCRPAFTAAIYEDLAWLGLVWESPVLLQSEHFENYRQALAKLSDMGLIYKCFCTRKEIKAQSLASGNAPQEEGDTIVYKGTCRNRPPRLDDEEKSYSLRLNIDKAMGILKGRDLYWYDEFAGKVQANPYRFGDVILARKDCPTSYYLACTLDDARQGITDIVRGKDLFAATDIQVLLQALLGLPTPKYHHHGLICDDAGKRLAKRADSESIKSYRERGFSPAEVLAKAGL